MQGPYHTDGAPGVFQTEKGDAEARRDSQRRMVAFFSKHLGLAR